MAKALFGNIIVDMRGKINGNVYSRNKGGAYVRTKVTPNNPRTSYQTTARGNLAAISTLWRTLSEAQRDAWNQAAPDWVRTNIFGNNLPVSGFNLFNKLNLSLASIGGAPITTPPIQNDFPVVSDVAIVIDKSSNSVNVTFSASASDADITWQFFGTRALSPGINFVSSQLRAFTYDVGDGEGDYDVSGAYIAKFGAIGAVGQKVFIEMWGVITATGQYQRAFLESTIIQA